MARYKMYWSITFSVCIVLAQNNANGAHSVSPVGYTGRSSQSTEVKMHSDLTERATDENGSALQINRRTRREIRTLVGMLKENARRLEMLTDSVERLTENAILMENTHSFIKENARRLEMLTDSVNRLTENAILMENTHSFIENLTNNVAVLLNRTATKDYMAAPFISIFTMLADFALSTSPRIGKNQTDFIKTLEYFRSNIENRKDYPFLDSELQSIIKWYIKYSCVEILNAGFTKSGVYQIRIENTARMIDVYCDQETEGGGWLVFQRRQDGSEDFYRSWEDYQRGFGNIEAEFWLGNDNLHDITKTAQELRVDLMDFDGNTVYAKYSSFSVGSPAEKFTLSVSGYSGTAGDSLKYHNGYKFTTKDNDNDASGFNCAVKCTGAWWYRDCHYSHLNGKYYSSAFSYKSISWYYWKNSPTSLKWTEMKIRPAV